MHIQVFDVGQHPDDFYVDKLYARDGFSVMCITHSMDGSFFYEVATGFYSEDDAEQWIREYRNEYEGHGYGYHPGDVAGGFL